MKHKMRRKAALTFMPVLVLFLFSSINVSGVPPDNPFTVTFETLLSMDHVDIYISITNNQDSNDNFPFKPLLNQTSIDIGKADVKFYEWKSEKYDVIICQECENEFENCTINNENNITFCNPYNDTVKNCNVCGNYTELRDRWEWKERNLTSEEKDIEKREISNQFEEIQIKKGETKRFRLRYDFGGIPTHPDTGMPGSYGFIYLDIKGALFYDFVNSSWWNESWLYKQEINISVPSGITPKNLPVLIEINTSNNGTNWNWLSECNSDMNVTRARFINGSETLGDAGKLDFWIANCSSTDELMLAWIESDQNMTSAGYVIYMYYGNPTASFESNGTATFYVFDDFGNANYIDKWTDDVAGGASCGCSESGQTLTIAPVNSYGWVYMTGVTVPSFEWAIGALVKVDTNAATNAEGTGGYHTIGVWSGTMHRHNDATNRVQSILDFGEPAVSGTALYNVGQYYVWEYVYNSTGKKGRLYHSNMTLIEEIHDDANPNPAGTTLGLLYEDGAAYVMSDVYDYFYVRKFYDPEPTYTVGIESEVPLITSIGLTVHSPINTTYSTTTINLTISANKTINASWYFLNNGIKTFFIPDTIFTAIEGANNITIFINDSDGNEDNETVYFSVIITPLIIISSFTSCVNSEILLVQTVENETVNGVSDFTVTQTYITCPRGCTNTSLYALGDPGCIESDLTLWLTLLFVVIVLVLLFKGTRRT